MNPRYFEVLASGTTMLLCNREVEGVYDGLGFRHLENMLMFDTLEDMLLLLLSFYSVVLAPVPAGSIPSTFNPLLYLITPLSPNPKPKNLVNAKPETRSQQRQKGDRQCSI